MKHFILTLLLSIVIITGLQAQQGTVIMKNNTTYEYDSIQHKFVGGYEIKLTNGRIVKAPFKTIYKTINKDDGYFKYFRTFNAEDEGLKYVGLQKISDGKINILLGKYNGQQFTFGGTKTNGNWSLYAEKFKNGVNQLVKIYPLKKKNLPLAIASIKTLFADEPAIAAKLESATFEYEVNNLVETIKEYNKIDYLKNDGATAVSADSPKSKIVFVRNEKGDAESKINSIKIGEEFKQFGNRQFLMFEIPQDRMVEVCFNTKGGQYCDLIQGSLYHAVNYRYPVLKNPFNFYINTNVAALKYTNKFLKQLSEKSSKVAFFNK